MENLAKQMRVSFSGLGQDNKDGPSNAKDRRLPLQKTQSFKGGKKTQNWFRRQFSGQMSQDNDPAPGDNGEFAMAVAAATYAINSLEEVGSLHQQKTTERAVTLNRNKSRKEDGMAGLPDPGKVSRRFSGEASMGGSEVKNQRTPEDPSTNQTLPEQSPGKVPRIKKTPTFSNEYPKDNGSTKLVTKVDARPAVNRTFSRSGSGKQDKTTAPGVGDTKADAWEKAEMARIKKKFERMTSTIVSWENEKKTKAKRQLEKTESEMARRRQRILQQYREEITRIDQIAGGARAAADEKRRNEETKAKEKANKIRSTGKAPATCFCF